MAAPETSSAQQVADGSSRQPPTREQFEFLLQRAGLALPQSEHDVLFEGAAYIHALVDRLNGMPLTRLASAGDPTAVVGHD